MFDLLMSRFFSELDLSRFDEIILPADWIIVSTKAAHDSIQTTVVLHHFIFSDRRPVAATIKTT